MILAKRFHPDINKAPGAKEKFADILEAYDVLSDKTKKKIYDKSGLTASELEDLEYTKSKESEFSGTPGQFTNEIFNEEEGETALTSGIPASKDNETIDSIISDPTSIEIYNRTEEFYGKAPVAKENLYTLKENMYDIITETNVSFMESIEGCTKTFSYNRYYLCEECSGEFC